MKILIVVDVQEGFSGSKNIAVACKKMVSEFVNNGNHIIVLEYLKFGETLEDISKELIDYPKGFFLKKDDQDGAPQIKNLCDNLKISKKIKEFHLCGAYRNDCVLSTAIGLGNAFQANVIAHSKAIDKSEDSPLWDRLEPQIKMLKKKRIELGGQFPAPSCSSVAYVNYVPMLNRPLWKTDEN